MGRRLEHVVSPYLQAHAGNPVDWWPWGSGVFAEAARRDVPVLVSIGYATCHWCHVMARESFSDPELAEYLNAHMVAVKVDREEHPEVDAAFLAAASAFTPHLGWPLTVFATPEGRVFYAGTYFPPRPAGGVPSFRQVLEAIVEAWTDRRTEVEETGAAVAAALAARPEESGSAPPTLPQLTAAVTELAGFEDPELGGFGTDAKFPNAPVIAFLAELGIRGDATAAAFAQRLWAAAQALRDPLDGGFFRYAVRRDWSEPHYERMLSDNAQLLSLAVAFGDEETAEAIVGFLLGVLRLPDGSFASAQDSESLVDGVRSEGGYYGLDAAARSAQPAPALDTKVLAGLNGLAIGALADAGVRFARPEWVSAAGDAADAVLRSHLVQAPEGPRLRRAARAGRTSEAAATLEDYGGLAGGLLRLALAAGEPSMASMARSLVEACLVGDAVQPPGGGDPVLAAHGIRVEVEQTEGATPSGAALFADAALRVDEAGGGAYRAVAEQLMASVWGVARERPIAYGASLALAVRVVAPAEQLVVVTGAPGAPDSGQLLPLARSWATPGRTLAILDEATARAFAAEHWELFAARTAPAGAATAYLCTGSVCRLPTADPAVLASELAGSGVRG